MTGPIATAEISTDPTSYAAGDAPAACQEPAPGPGTPGDAPPAVTIQELLVEEVSIDGMCGVY
jgi:mycofactocin precursor